MSIQDCLVKTRKFVKDSGLEISDSRLNELALQLEAIGGGALTPAEFTAKALEFVDKEQARWYEKKKLETAMIIVKRENALKSVLANKEKWKADPRMAKFKNSDMMAVESFRAWLQGGSLRAGESTNIGVDRMRKTVHENIQSFFNEAVKDVKTQAAAGALDRDALIELHALDNGLQQMSTGNAEALKYAEAIKATRDKILTLKQAYNPYLEAAQDYLVKRYHNRERITADRTEAGKQAWVDQMMETYGKRSFPELSPDEKIDAFKDIYDRIDSGTYGSITDDSASDKFVTVRGDGGNLLRRMSRSRSLIAESPELEYKYLSKYGPRTLYEGLDRTIQNAAKDIALLSKFGPNPQGMYEGLFSRTMSKLSGAEAENFKNEKATFDKMFRQVTGAQNAPARSQIARFSQGLLTLDYLSKTGKAMIRSLPDIALSALTLRSTTGENLFSSAFNLTSEYVKGFVSAGYAKERLSDLGLAFHASHADLMNSLGSPDAQPGAVTKLARAMGSLNLMNRHVDAIRAGHATLISRLLDSVSAKSHADLPDVWKQGLSRYGIGEAEWEMIRQGKEDLNGKGIVTPEGVESLPDDAVRGYLEKTGQLVKNTEPTKQILDYGRFQLALKLGTLINDHIDLGAAHPGDRQRYFMYSDTNINQGWGMMHRLMWQFKSAALVSSDVFRRAYFSGEGHRGDYAGLAQYAIMSGFLWTVGEYLNQLSSGQTPEDPTTPKFVGKAIIGSGMAGVYGDVFLSEFQRTGMSNKVLAGASAILGPGIGTGLEAGATVASLAEGALGTGGEARRAMSEGKRKAANLVMGLIPGQNLFYTKAAFDYYFANQLKEFMGPGYLGYLERRTNQTPGLFTSSQEYLFGRPTSRNFIGD